MVSPDLETSLSAKQKSSQELERFGLDWHTLRISSLCRRPRRLYFHLLRSLTKFNHLVRNLYSILDFYSEKKKKCSPNDLVYLENEVKEQKIAFRIVKATVLVNASLNSFSWIPPRSHRAGDCTGMALVLTGMSPGWSQAVLPGDGWREQHTRHLR